MLPYSSAQRLCSLFRAISVDGRGFLLDIFDLTTTHLFYFGTSLFVLLQSLKLIALCVCNMEDSRIPRGAPTETFFWCRERSVPHEIVRLVFLPKSKRSSTEVVSAFFQ